LKETAANLKQLNLPDPAQGVLLQHVLECLRVHVEEVVIALEDDRRLLFDYLHASILQVSLLEALCFVEDRERIAWRQVLHHKVGAKLLQLSYLVFMGCVQD